MPLLAAEADVADGVRAYDVGWYEDALAEFLPAAEAGDTQAQLALASMYQFGEGVAQNDVEAARWTRAAAESGDAVAQINLSQFFAAGRGVERDVAQSYFWLLLTAGQRNSWAKARIAAAGCGDHARAGGGPRPGSSGAAAHYDAVEYDHREAADIRRRAENLTTA